MGSKKSKKRRAGGKGSGQKRRKFPTLLLIVLCAGVVLVGGWLILDNYTKDTERKSGISATGSNNKTEIPDARPDHLRELIGRWVRPDGGYVIDIRNVDADGKLQAAYFNPRPIHVSQARVTKAQKKLQIFLELRDVGYPGATYTLTYNAQHDVLAGLYFQPTVDQTFDVVFVRIQ